MAHTVTIYTTPTCQFCKMVSKEKGSTCRPYLVLLTGSNDTTLSNTVEQKHDPRTGYPVRTLMKENNIFIPGDIKGSALPCFGMSNVTGGAEGQVPFFIEPGEYRLIITYKNHRDEYNLIINNEIFTLSSITPRMFTILINNEKSLEYKRVHPVN